MHTTMSAVGAASIVVFRCRSYGDYVVTHETHEKFTNIIEARKRFIALAKAHITEQLSKIYDNLVEPVAEMTAALIGQSYGMDKYMTEDSVAYLKCWLKNLKQSSEYIKMALAEVRRAATMITGEIHKLTEKEEASSKVKVA